MSQELHGLRDNYASGGYQMKRFYSALLLATSVGFSESLPSLFSNSTNRDPISGTFNIGAGNGPTAATSVQVNYYTSSNCSAGVLFAHQITAGAGYTFHQNTTVTVSSVGIYTFGDDNGVMMNTVQSVYVMPIQGSVDIFTAPGCFAVSCSGSDCIGSAVANVNLDF